MNHAQAQALTEAYHSGTLDRENVRAFHAHLKECEACQAGIRARAAQVRFQKAGDLRRKPDPVLNQKLAANRRRLLQWTLLALVAVLLLKAFSPH